MTGLLDVPAWALVSLVIGALAGGALLGVFVDRRLRQHRDRAAHVPSMQDERLRLAAELHQAVSHEVSAVLLHSAGARAVPATGDPRVAAALDLITQASTSCMHELVRQRDVLQDLGSTTSTGTGTCDLTSLGDLVGRARAHGVQVGVRTTGRPGIMDPSIGRTVHLLVASALHAAQAAHCPRAAVDLTWLAQSLELRILVGTDLPHRNAHNHTVLADRVRLLGGELHVHAHSDGELLTVNLPVRPRPQEAAEGDVPTRSP